MRAGLCLFDPIKDKIVILKRYKQYLPSSKKIIPHGFVEQYSLPRGRVLNKHESLLHCAIREFIEETRIFVKEFIQHEETFELIWEDPTDKFWQYKIFFIETDLNPENIFEVDEQTKYICHKLNFDVKTCKLNSYEPAKRQVMSFEQYSMALKRQLPAYVSSNYTDFLNHLKNLYGKCVHIRTNHGGNPISNQ